MSRKKTALITPPEDASTIAAISREKAWQADKEQTWNQKPLEPWTRERESLFIRITELDEATSGLESVPVIIQRLEEKGSKLGIEQVINPHQFIEAASLVLFLASHKPEQWDHLRGRPAAFIRAANEWAEKNIPLGMEWPAIHQAVALRTAHQQMIAIRRPSAHSGGSSGN